VSQLPDPQSLDALIDAFERVRSPRVDPADASHQRKVELIQIWFAVVVMGLLTAVSVVLILWSGMPADEVKVACGWIGAVLGAAANTLRKP
jgi:hypothetical protein